MIAQLIIKETTTNHDHQASASTRRRSRRFGSNSPLVGTIMSSQTTQLRIHHGKYLFNQANREAGA